MDAELGEVFLKYLVFRNKNRERVENSKKKTFLIIFFLKVFFDQLVDLWVRIFETRGRSVFDFGPFSVYDFSTYTHSPGKTNILAYSPDPGLQAT